VRRSWRASLVPAALLPFAVVPAALALAGCGDVCEDAAQICADERRVAAPDDEGQADAECIDRLERHAQCIVNEDSCHPDVVAGCWAASAE
jgi:hypothetical protein